MDRYVPVVVGIALLVGAVGGHAAAGGTPSEHPPLDDPRVERFKQTAAGCRGSVTSAGGTTVGPGGRFASFGVMDTDAPNAALAMEVTRTSPEAARITTYRVDLSSHAASESENVTCAGEVAYRLNLTVDYRETMRVAVYEEGDVVSCGGTGCSPIMVDERPRWWANGTV